MPSSCCSKNYCASDILIRQAGRAQLTISFAFSILARRCRFGCPGQDIYVDPFRGAGGMREAAFQLRARVSSVGVVSGRGQWAGLQKGAGECTFSVPRLVEHLVEPDLRFHILF